MEKWEESMKEAAKNIHIADHMMNVTYKLINDPKLLLMILKKLDSALKEAILSLLYYERYYKRIPPFHENFESTLDMVKTKVGARYNIKRDHLDLAKEINAIVREHKASPMEFVRHDKLVICSDNYGMQVLSEDRIKEFIQVSKSFVNSINSAVSMKSD